MKSIKQVLQIKFKMLHSFEIRFHSGISILSSAKLRHLYDQFKNTVSKLII